MDRLLRRRWPRPDNALGTARSTFADNHILTLLRSCEFVVNLICGMRRILFPFVLCAFVISSGGGEPAEDMNAVAERYARLVLALGQHDPDYVDAFYGPAEWKTQAEKEKQSLDAIAAESKELSAKLAESSDGPTPHDPMLKLRREYLQKQISALAARVRMLKGEKLKFDDESRALYDAVAPTFDDSHFDEIIKQLEAKIPGEGPLWQRYENCLCTNCNRPTACWSRIRR